MTGLHGKRIVMVSLLPDAGHLKSLLLILKNLQNAGADVHALVPNEAEVQVSSFGISYELIGSVVPEDGPQSLQTLSRSGKWKHLLFTHLEIQKRYFLELTWNGVRRKPLLVDRLAGTKCDALLCDPHIFLDEYCAIATDLGVPLFVHEATGTLYRLQSRSSFLKNESGISALLERVSLEYVPAWHYRFNKLFRKRRFKDWSEKSAFICKQRASYPEPKKCDVHKITTGSANLENKYLFGGTQITDDYLRFGSLDPKTDWGSGQKVMDWLSGCEESSVVYVSFGTLVSPPTYLVHRIVAQLLAQKKRVLVASSLHSEQLKARYPDNILWVNWAPQAAVLASPKVSAFVSHVGATSYREALWFGKPVLGIPLVWDQFYCAWAAETLGIGRIIRNFNIGERALSEIVLDVLTNNSHSANARRLSRELIAEDGDNQLVRYFEEVLAEDNDAYKSNYSFL